MGKASSGLTILDEEAKILIGYGVADAESRVMLLTRSALRVSFCGMDVLVTIRNGGALRFQRLDPCYCK